MNLKIKIIEIIIAITNNTKLKRFSEKCMYSDLNATGCHRMATPTKTEEIAKTNTAPAATSFATLTALLSSLVAASLVFSIAVFIISLAKTNALVIIKSATSVLLKTK